MKNYCHPTLGKEAAVWANGTKIYFHYDAEQLLNNCGRIN